MMRVVGLVVLLSACVQDMPTLDEHDTCANHSDCTKAGELCLAGACWVPHAPCYGLGFDAHPSGATFPGLTAVGDSMRLEAWVRWTKHSRSDESGNPAADLGTFLALPADEARGGFGLFISEGEKGRDYLPPGCDIGNGPEVTTNGQVIGIVKSGDQALCIVSPESLAPERWHHLVLDVKFSALGGPSGSEVSAGLSIDGGHIGSINLEMERPVFRQELCSGSDCRVGSAGGPLYAALADILLRTDPGSNPAPRYPLTKNINEDERLGYWRSWELEPANIIPGNTGSAQYADDCDCLASDTVNTLVCSD
jgi:hypothetical protein